MKIFLSILMFTQQVHRKNPIALLFDRKDQYHLPAPAWEKPLPGAEEIIYALRRLNQQYQEQWKFPLRPRALNIVNTKGDVLGYVYTGVETIQMDRETDGRVTVHMPVLQRIQGGGGGGGGGGRMINAVAVFSPRHFSVCV